MFKKIFNKLTRWFASGNFVYKLLSFFLTLNDYSTWKYIGEYNREKNVITNDVIR